MGFFDIPEKYRDVYYYIVTFTANAIIAATGIWFYVASEAAYSLADLKLIPIVLSVIAILYNVFTISTLLASPSEYELVTTKLIRTVPYIGGIVVGAMVIINMTINENGRSTDVVLSIILTSVSAIGSLYNERETAKPYNSWNIPVSKHQYKIRFGYFIVGCVLVMSMLWMKDLIQFSSYNVVFWVFFAMAALMIVMQVIPWDMVLFQDPTENVILKDILNTLLLFSYAALASASSKLHANTDEYLAFNGRDRNSLMIMTHVGLWASIVLVALNKTLARQSTQTITVEEDSEVTEFDRLIF
jgi:hypothetical protein